MNALNRAVRWTGRRFLDRLKRRSEAARLSHLERQIGDVHRQIADLKLALALEIRRTQAVTDLYEYRIDQIYARVNAELAGALGAGLVSIEREEDVDRDIRHLLRSGFAQPGDLDGATLDEALSATLRPGRSAAPLSLLGYRIDHGLARDLGRAVEILASERDGRVDPNVSGPFKRLATGHYVVRAELEMPERVGEVAGSVALDILALANRRVLGSVDVAVPPEGGRFEIRQRFEWDAASAADDIAFRLYQRANQRLLLHGIELQAIEDV